MTETSIAWLAGLLGLALGSFLNVCTLRWPRDESVVRPPSRCPGCGGAIRPVDNVPVLSWLLLGGRCRSCREPISVQYPLVELATALVWGGTVAALGPTFEALRAAIFVTILLGIAISDARFYIIPDQFSLGGAVLGLALAFGPGGIEPLEALVGAVGGYAALWLVGVGGTWLVRRLNPSRLEEAFDQHDEQRADETVRERVRALGRPVTRGVLVGSAGVAAVVAGLVGGGTTGIGVGAAALAAVAVLLAWAEAFEDPTFDDEPEADDGAPLSALGGGDVRMMALVGAFVGLPGVALTVLGGSVLALVAAVPLTLVFRQLIPLGIFLAYAAAGTLWWGQEVVDWYFGLMGL